MSFGSLVETMEKYRKSFMHISPFSGHSVLEIRKYVQSKRDDICND